MNKEIVQFLSIGLLTLGISMIAQPLISHAWTSTNKYTWTSGKADAAIYYTNTNKNAYIWNSRFNKKTA